MKKMREEDKRVTLCGRISPQAYDFSSQYMRKHCITKSFMSFLAFEYMLNHKDDFEEFAYIKARELEHRCFLNHDKYNNE